MNPAATLVVIAGSAGGITATIRVLSELPVDFPAAVVVVQHRSSATPGVFEQILQKATRLQVKTLLHGERIRPGTVYVVPGDFHAIVTPARTLELTDGRRIRHVRSSANPLFESAGKVYGPRALGVVLTGSGRDATNGVQAIRLSGGTVVAQDEATCEHFGMPRSAIATGAVTYVLPIDRIGAAISAFAERTAPAESGNIDAGSAGSSMS